MLSKIICQLIRKSKSFCLKKLKEDLAIDKYLDNCFYNEIKVKLNAQFLNVRGNKVTYTYNIYLQIYLSLCSYVCILNVSKYKYYKAEREKSKSSWKRAYWKLRHLDFSSCLDRSLVVILKWLKLYLRISIITNYF